jgi:hypothetical protein
MIFLLDLETIQIRNAPTKIVVDLVGTKREGGEDTPGTDLSFSLSLAEARALSVRLRSMLSGDLDPAQAFFDGPCGELSSHRIDSNDHEPM